MDLNICIECDIDGYVAHCPAFQCWGHGRTIAEAISAVLAAMQDWLNKASPQEVFACVGE